MRRAIVILLFAAFAVLGLALHDAIAYGQEKKAAAPKESRWHGRIVRINKDESKMEVQRGSFTRTIRFDSSTKWTEGTKVINMSEFKEGTDVLCLGTYESGSNVMTATRVDLRKR
jgi:Cu/Ag efflux protein CusF